MYEGRVHCHADQANTVQHWQLRDLVHAPDAEDSLYFVRGGASRRLFTKNAQVGKACLPVRMSKEGPLPIYSGLEQAFAARHCNELPCFMQVETVQSHGIAPTAMTASHGYIAAGAQRGMVINLLIQQLLKKSSISILYHTG